jgi:hypothetical protein
LGFLFVSEFLPGNKIGKIKEEIFQENPGVAINQAPPHFLQDVISTIAL